MEFTWRNGSGDINLEDISAGNTIREAFKERNVDVLDLSYDSVALQNDKVVVYGVSLELGSYAMELDTIAEIKSMLEINDNIILEGLKIEIANIQKYSKQLESQNNSIMDKIDQIFRSHNIPTSVIGCQLSNKQYKDQLHYSNIVITLDCDLTSNIYEINDAISEVKDIEGVSIDSIYLDC